MVGFAPLDKEPTVTVKFFSAGLGASTADCLTFPLDAAKVRLMVQGERGGLAAVPKYNGMFHTLITVSKTEGPLALYNGLVPGLQRQMAFASIRIGLYDTVKECYSSIFGSETGKTKNIPLRIAAGVTTGAAAVMLAQGTDVVKIRMQAPGGKAKYGSCMNAYRSITRTEGIRKGLWKGWQPNVARNAIVNVAELVSYDLVKNSILERQLMLDNMPCHFVSAFVAGIIATIFASPVDVVKTRYMNSTAGIYSGAIDCAIQMYKEGGLKAFYKGFVPNYTRLGTWNIFTFVLFEQFKRGLTHGNDYIYETLNEKKTISSKNESFSRSYSNSANARGEKGNYTIQTLHHNTKSEYKPPVSTLYRDR